MQTQNDSRTHRHAAPSPRPRTRALLALLTAASAGCAPDADAAGARSSELSVGPASPCPAPCTATADGGAFPAVISLAVTPTDPQVALGADQAFTATGRMLLGSQDLTRSVAWTSSDPSVADFDRATPTHAAVPGLLHTYAPGRVTVRATYGSGLSARAATTSAVVFPPFGGGARFDGEVHALAADDRVGALYVGGQFNTYNGARSTKIARILRDGNRDPGFASGDLFNNPVRAVALAADGSGDVFVGGNFTSYRGNNVGGIVRLDVRGALVSRFACAIRGQVRSVLPARDGTRMVYIGGDDLATPAGVPLGRLLRVDENCVADPNFQLGTGVDGSVYAMAFAPDVSRDLYVAGYFGSFNGAARPHVVRVTPRGVAVGTFATGGGFDSGVVALAPVPSPALTPAVAGDLYVGGNFYSYGGATFGRAVTRLDGGGARDVAFATGLGADAWVNSLLALPDGSGDVYIGGAFATYNGRASRGLIRVFANGAPDARFSVGVGFDGAGGPTISAVIRAPDTTGDIYVGGAFDSYNRMPAGRLIRLSERGVPR